MPKKTTKASANKTVTIKHHHRHPYRKHHYAWLVFFTIAFFILFVSAVQYRTLVSASIRGSLDFVAGLFSLNNNYNLRISSTYGFSLGYDQKVYYASAIDTVTGDLVIGADLSNSRAYGVVRIAKSDVESEFSSGAMNVTYHYEKEYQANKLPTVDELNDMAIVDGKIAKASFDKSTSSEVTLGGKAFTKTSWTLKTSGGLTSGLSSKFDTYVAMLNNKPITIVVNYGLDGQSTDQPFKPVLDSLNFSAQTAFIPTPNAEVVSKIDSQKSLLDMLVLGETAHAATSNSMPAEKVAALNSPSVVKIYNVFCKDVSVNNGRSKITFTGICSGSMGSGFFVSQDGYIATNGHVGTATAKDLVIINSLIYYSQGKTSYFEFLANMTSLKQADFVGKTQKEVVGLIIDAFYTLPDSVFNESNNTNNLLVLLNTKTPDVAAIVDYTAKLKQYPESDNLKRAELVTYNYRALDNLSGSGYKGSDVALLKISGINYPVTQLGSIDELSTGSQMFILGFPGNATNGALVETGDAIVTLTTGNVSSIKNAAGDSRKLIETDTLIGHGNSGGPAFASSGKVIGIATYASFTQLDATYNYVRDIADFKKLVSDKSITLDTNSTTQAEWSKGLDYFYDSRYSKALESFNKVKTYYPYTANLDKFIKDSQDAIAAGKDVQDFPTLWVAIGAVVALLGVGVTVFVIIRHRSKHNLYNAGVASGAIQPMQSGSAPQFIPAGTTFPPVTPQQPVYPAPTPPPAPTNPMNPNPSNPPLPPTDYTNRTQ